MPRSALSARVGTPSPPPPHRCRPRFPSAVAVAVVVIVAAAVESMLTPPFGLLLLRCNSAQTLGANIAPFPIATSAQISTSQLVSLAWT